MQRLCDGGVALPRVCVGRGGAAPLPACSSPPLPVGAAVRRAANGRGSAAPLQQSSAFNLPTFSLPAFTLVLSFPSFFEFFDHSRR